MIYSVYGALVLGSDKPAGLALLLLIMILVSIKSAGHKQCYLLT